ncbi:MAG: response regulator transcription factor [Acidobacteriota bacterium]
MSQTVLVIDDDQNICELIRLYLDGEGYQLHFAHDGSAGLDLVRRIEPDLVILDLMLPLINGYEVCRMIRKSNQVPILMLTAKDSTRDKIEGLDAGADDYLVKPFDPQELAARVRARLRRTSGQEASGATDKLVIGDLCLDLGRYEVNMNGQLIDLKPREVALLHFLMINKNIVFSREQLLEKVWGYDYVGETRTVDVHIRRLREKLGDSERWELKTIWGVGYKLEETRQ